MASPVMELVLLGTTGPVHVGNRFGTAQVIIAEGATILVDCGWGATLRMYQAGLRLPEIDALFFTHLHSDHTTDLADFLTMRWLGGIDRPLTVYGPEGTAEMVAGYRQGTAADTGFRLAHHGEKLSPLGTECEVTEIQAGEEPVEVASIGPLTVKAFEVDHRPVMPAFGFRLECGGRVITLSGDTNPCPGLINGSQDADILVCDSMNLDMMRQFEDRLRVAGFDMQAALLADAHTYHADVQDMAKIANTARVKHLVLSHVLPPIADEGPPVEQFVAGLVELYKGKLTLARDLQRFQLE